MNNHSAKSILILSWNTIPLKNKKNLVSATGMRTYKLALGLLNNGKAKVDVAIKERVSHGESADTRINIVHWDTDDQVANLANSYDVVIINSNYDASSPYILDKINDNVVKVVDAFIPFYFEESMRTNVDTVAREGHVGRLSSLHATLAKADYILVANQEQKQMYLGAFGAVNLLNFDNFANYKDNFIINFPGVIGENIPKKNPYQAYKDKIGDKKIVIWFGSTYSWYDIDPLLEIYNKNKKLIKTTILFVVGAKNPNFASTPLNQQINNDSIVFVPWVNYSERLAWLKYANLGISLNRITPENTFSFRNRLVDFIEAGLPLATNGFDPLGEMIINKSGGIKLDSNNLSEQILIALESKANHELRDGVSKLKKGLDNTACNQELSKKINSKQVNILNSDFLVYPKSRDNGVDSISTKQLTKLTLNRLQSSAKARIKKDR